MTPNQLRRRYEQRVGRRDQLQQQLGQVQEEVRSLKRLIKIAEQAQFVVQTVSMQTQKQLEYRISQVVTAAEEAVFDDRAYQLVASFIERRGKTECDLFFSRNGQQVDPLASAGFGAVDIAAFALRASCWSMMHGVAPILILDEPYKHIKGAEHNQRAIKMVKEVSDQLGLQIIMVSDERAPIEDIRASADRVFKVSIKDGISQVAVV